MDHPTNLADETDAFRRAVADLTAAGDRFRRALAPTMGDAPVQMDTAEAMATAAFDAPSLLVEGLLLLLPLCHVDDIPGLARGIQAFQDRRRKADKPDPDDIPELAAVLNGIAESMAAVYAGRRTAGSGNGGPRPH